MCKVTAWKALEKVRYFLAQAETAEADADISRARLPFAANMEASIIYARSSLDHLRNELAAQPGYRQWHDAEWKRLDLIVFSHT